jgi:hypothetical protein
VTLLPASILSAVVNFAMKSPPREAAHATCEFLRSKRGVRQALYDPLSILDQFSLLGPNLI